MPPAERAAAGRAARAIDPDRDAKVLGVELLFEADHAARLEVAPEHGAHDLGMILDDVQGAILNPVAERNHAAHPHPFFFEAAICPVPPVTSRSNWAKEKGR